MALYLAAMLFQVEVFRAVPSLWKARIGGISGGRGREKNMVYCSRNSQIHSFLMSWFEIKCWTRIPLAHMFLNPNFWLSPFIPLNLQFVFSYLALEAKGNDGWPKWNSLRQSKKHRIVLAKFQAPRPCADPN